MADAATAAAAAAPAFAVVMRAAALPRVPRLPFVACTRPPPRRRRRPFPLLSSCLPACVCSSSGESDTRVMRQTMPSDVLMSDRRTDLGSPARRQQRIGRIIPVPDPTSRSCCAESPPAQVLSPAVVCVCFPFLRCPGGSRHNRLHVTLSPVPSLPLPLSIPSLRTDGWGR